MAEQKRRGGRRPKSQEPGGSGPQTLLQKWLDENGYTSADLERVTGIIRQSMKLIREGNNPTKATMIRILRGARILSRDNVQITDLFDFEPDSPENAPLRALLAA